MCMLDLSKVLICESHYDYIKIKYGYNRSLLFTDTDSLIHEIDTEDVYEDFSFDKDIQDFRNHSLQSKYYDDSSKIAVGKAKGETTGVAIEEFFGVNPSMYSFSVDDISENKKSRGCG